MQDKSKGCRTDIRRTLRSRSYPLEAVGKISDGHKISLCLKIKVVSMRTWRDHTFIFMKGNRTIENSTVNEKGWGRKMILTLLHISLKPDQGPQSSMLNYTAWAPRYCRFRAVKSPILSGLLHLFWLRETKLLTVVKVHSKFEFVQ